MKKVRVGAKTAKRRPKRGSLPLANAGSSTHKLLGSVLGERRRILKLTQEQLSRESGVNYTTLTKIESGVIKNPSVEIVSKLARALNISLDTLLVPKTLQGPEALLALWGDILHTLSQPRDFMCISGIEERSYEQTNRQALLKFIAALKQKGFYQKLLVCEGDTNFLEGDHLEYRFVPREHFYPTPMYVYKDKVAIVIWSTPLQVIIMESPYLAEAYRRQFLFIWEHAKPARRQGKQRK